MSRYGIWRVDDVDRVLFTPARLGLVHVGVRIENGRLDLGKHRKARENLHGFPATFEGRGAVPAAACVWRWTPEAFQSILRRSHPAIRPFHLFSSHLLRTILASAIIGQARRRITTTHESPGTIYCPLSPLGNSAMHGKDGSVFVGYGQSTCGWALEHLLKSPVWPSPVPSPSPPPFAHACLRTVSTASPLAFSVRRSSRSGDDANM